MIDVVKVAPESAIPLAQSAVDELALSYLHTQLSCAQCELRTAHGHMHRWEPSFHEHWQVKAGRFKQRAIPVGS